MKTKRGSLTILILLIVIIAGYFGFRTIANWFNTYEVKFNQILAVQVKPPFSVVKREPIIQKIVLDYPSELIDTPIKKYIAEKFGPYDAKIALAIVQAESGFNDMAINVNKGGSVDLGCWQINFPTHKGTISPKDALDCHKATDWAYDKYKRDGNFNAWVSFTNGGYLKNL